MERAKKEKEINNNNINNSYCHSCNSWIFGL